MKELNDVEDPILCGSVGLGRGFHAPLGIDREGVVRQWPEVAVAKFGLYVLSDVDSGETGNVPCVNALVAVLFLKIEPGAQLHSD